ncbi:MAG: hypothetical protein R6X33_14825 [Candidatus Brocadiia bacterium]
MKWTVRTVIVLTALGLAAVLSAGAAEEGAQREPEQADVEEPLGADEVQMVELNFGERRVVGRLIMETHNMIRLESPAGGAIGYDKGTIESIRRYTVPAYQYHERLGDAVRDRAWSADAPDRFIEARRAYRRALELARKAEDRQRLEHKLENLTEERQEWQREALRREELRKAAAEADLTELEKELAEERLATLQRHEQILQQMQRFIQDMQEENRDIRYAIDNLQRRVVELEDDVDDLERRNNVFITSRVFLDLRSSHRRLERKVERLERDMRRE